MLKITDGNITRKSVTFEVIPPPMLQSNDHTKVDTVEYAINEEPTDGENILRQESVFKQCDSAESHLALPTQQQPIRVKVNNLKTERKVRANYNTGDTILGNEIEFETRPQTGMVVLLVTFFQACACFTVAALCVKDGRYPMLLQTSIDRLESSTHLRGQGDYHSQECRAICSYMMYINFNLLNFLNLTHSFLICINQRFYGA